SSSPITQRGSDSAKKQIVGMGCPSWPEGPSLLDSLPAVSGLGTQSKLWGILFPRDSPEAGRCQTGWSTRVDRLAGGFTTSWRSTLVPGDGGGDGSDDRGRCLLRATATPPSVHEYRRTGVDGSGAPPRRPAQRVWELRRATANTRR